MFKIILYDNSIMKSAFNSISNIVDDVQIQLDHDGLRLNALDKAHITFVHFELEASVFDEYELEYPVSINISTTEFMKVLSRCKNDDTLILEEDEGNLITIFKNNVSTRTFRIRLIDMEYDQPKAPSLNYEFVASIPVKIFKENISDAELFSEKLRIRHSADDDYLYIHGDGDFGETSSRYLTEAEKNGECDAVYNISNIKDFLKSEKFSDTIKINCSVNTPILLEFELGTGDGLLSFLLAPRLEEEE